MFKTCWPVIQALALPCCTAGYCVGTDLHATYAGLVQEGPKFWHPDLELLQVVHYMNLQGEVSEQVERVSENLPLPCFSHSGAVRDREPAV